MTSGRCRLHSRADHAGFASAPGRTAAGITFTAGGFQVRLRRKVTSGRGRLHSREDSRCSCPQPAASSRQRPLRQAGNRRRPAQGANQAAALIATLKGQSLPQAQQHLAAARGKGSRALDYSALARQLSAAQATLASAEKDLAAGNSAAALQKATIAQNQISDVENAIAAAQQGGGSDNKGQGNDNRNDSSRGQGGN